MSGEPKIDHPIHTDLASKCQSRDLNLAGRFVPISHTLTSCHMTSFITPSYRGKFAIEFSSDQVATGGPG